MTKKCSICGQQKSRSAFYKRTRAKDGLQSQCKLCEHIVTGRSYRKRKQRDPQAVKDANFRSKLATYGLTPKQYRAMQVAQNNRCAICGELETHRVYGTLCNLSVDHNRETKKVRALLCRLCNSGIAHLKHNPIRLRKAAAYLEYHGG